MNKIRRNNTKISKPCMFYIYTVLLPFLLLPLPELSEKFGMRCGDTCDIYSKEFVYMIVAVVLLIGLLDLILLIVCRSKIRRDGVAFGLVLSDWAFCFYALLYIFGGPWMLMIILPALVVTIPVKFILWGLI